MPFSLRAPNDADAPVATLVVSPMVLRATFAAVPMVGRPGRRAAASGASPSGTVGKG